MPKGFWIGLCIVLMSLQASAIQAVVSHAVFYLPGLSVGANAELYWQVDPQSLHYLRTSENTWETQIRTDLVIKSGNTIIKEEHYLLQTAPFAALADANHQPILDLKKYGVQPGKIEFELRLTDMGDSTKKFVFIDSFTVKAQTGIYYSDIQLLDTAFASETKSVFLKNNMQQVPLCANFLDDNKSVIHYYAELYNANDATDVQKPLSQKIYISRKENEGTLQRLLSDDSVWYTPMQPILGSFKIPALPSGNYYLNINLLDRDNVIVASKSLFFQRYNNKPKEEVSVASAKADTTFQPVTVLDLHKTFVMKYTLPELKAILKMILPVASPIEAQSIRSFLKNPDEGYMRYFIYNHFSSINKKAPEAAWKDFTERIKEINKKFGTSSDPGYETDRGRIYLKYGKPDEELTEESERGALPYEIWQYNNINEQYKNAVFLFYRPSNMLSGFQLLHSTVNVEVRNPNWRSVLFANHSDSGDPDSKAERYLGKR